MSLYINSSTGVDLTLRPQIELGTTKTDYSHHSFIGHKIDTLFEGNISTNTNYIIDGKFSDYLFLLFVLQQSYGIVSSLVLKPDFVRRYSINLTCTQNNNLGVQIFEQIKYVNDTTFECLKSGYRNYNSNSWSDNPYGLMIYGIK